MPVPYKPKLKAPIPALYVPQQLAEKLGSGLTVPMNFDTISQTFDVTNGPAKVKQDIWLCLRTPVFRRLGQPDYGSELPLLIFEPYNQNTQRRMIQATEGSLSLWVPQITVEAVELDTSSLDNNTVLILINYLINGTAFFDILKIALTQNGEIQLPPDTFGISGFRN